MSSETDEILIESGIYKDDPNWSSQWNLTYCAVSGQGFRCGLEPRIKEIMTLRGYSGWASEEVKNKFYLDFSNVISQSLGG